MTGRAEVNRLQQQLDAAFIRSADLAGRIELLSDHAKYLCVLVSGFLEQSVQELLLENARRSGGPRLQRFVEQRTRHATNMNTERLIELLGSFDPDWASDIRSFVVDERKAAVNSIVALRNVIAHGGSTSITFRAVADYYALVKTVVDRIADLCAPLTTSGVGPVA